MLLINYNNLIFVEADVCAKYYKIIYEKRLVCFPFFNIRYSSKLLGENDFASTALKMIASF